MTTDENTYILGASESEMVRLVEQDRFMTKVTGGLFPEGLDPSSYSTILDVGCGPGGWALDVAETYPNVQVVGFDINAGMIRYARNLAQASRLDNVRFEVMDATKPLAFEDGSFSLVNSRFMSGFMRKEDWPVVMQELVRVTKRGGIVRLTDAAWEAETSSPAYHRILGYTIEAMMRVGQSFSPDGRHNSITMMLQRFLREAGLQDIREMAHVINFSAGTPLSGAFYEDTKVAFKQMQPFQLGTGVATQEQLDQAYNEVLVEMLAEDFCGIMYMLTAWGQRS